MSDVLKNALAQLGVQLQVDQQGDGRPHDDAPYDLFLGFTAIDYPDGATFLRKLVGEIVPTRWFPRGIAARVAEVDRLGGARRDSAAEALADDLVRDADVVPYATYERAEFLSPRLGCKVFPPLGYGVDLAMMCRSGT